MEFTKRKNRGDSQAARDAQAPRTAMASDTQIMTVNGWKYITELEPADKILTSGTSVFLPIIQDGPTFIDRLAHAVAGIFETEGRN